MSFDENNPMEYFLNAQVNFENLKRLIPSLSNHPIYLMAQEQLDNGIKKLEEKLK